MTFTSISNWSNYCEGFTSHTSSFSGPFTEKSKMSKFERKLSPKSWKGKEMPVVSEEGDQKCHKAQERHFLSLFMWWTVEFSSSNHWYFGFQVILFFLFSYVSWFSFQAFLVLQLPQARKKKNTQTRGYKKEERRKDSRVLVGEWHSEESRQGRIGRIQRWLGLRTYREEKEAR